jgi:outer membrane protein assembly factor BamB
MTRRSRLLASFLIVVAAQAACPAAEETQLAARLLGEIGENAGFCVHLGFRDSKLTVALSQDGAFLVHGLSRRRETISGVRESIRASGLAGAVTVEHSQLKRLPYSENLVDLLVAEDLSGQLADGPLLNEIVRVLRPGGIAMLGQRPARGEPALTAAGLQKRLARAGIKQVEVDKIHGLAWLKFRKPRQAKMDQWTHRRYDASSNPVSRDTVDIPNGVRWVAGPKWPTGNRKSSVPGVVVSDKRLVYIFEDELTIGNDLKKKKTLVARDAFNGLLLWKRTTSQANTAILIHVGDRIFNVIKKGGPLVALDGRTGNVLKTYKHAVGINEAFYHKGLLVVRKRKEIRCIDAATGELKWQKKRAGGNLVSGDGNVFFVTAGRKSDGQKVFQIGCLDLATGSERWRTGTQLWKSKPTALELVLYQQGTLLLAGNGSHAVSAKDGRHLWSYDYKLIGHGGSFSKVVFSNDLLWVHNAESIGPAGTSANAWEGLDPRTGKLRNRIAHGAIKHRCFFDVATERFFLCGSMDFVSVETKAHTRFTAARNSCRTAGVVPANGMVYTFPHGCACYPLLRGFMGLTSNPLRFDPVDQASRFQKGKAFGEPTRSSGKQDGGWRTHRGDPRRSGSIDGRGPGQLKLLWKQALVTLNDGVTTAEWDHKNGGRLTSSVVAGETVFVASSDTHELFALNAQTGKPRWRFAAGGRIDCAPTIFDGLCLLGSRDGWVYCLRADDGELLWRFRGSPTDERIVAYGQLESKWPVVGGVLVNAGLAYFSVGRHAGADGGVHVYAAQPRTGKIVWHNRPKEFATLPDLLVAGDGAVHMADWEFDARTGKDKSSPSTALRSARLGLLDDAWYKRPLAMRKNLQQWAHRGENGQLLVFNKDRICGFRGASTLSGGNGNISGNALLYTKPLQKGGGEWASNLLIGSQIKGMVLADDRLFVAGRLHGYDSRSHGVWAINAIDGKLLLQQKLPASLIHECLSIAGGRVFVSMQNGEVACLGEP